MRGLYRSHGNKHKAVVIREAQEGREPLRAALHPGPARERRPLRLPRPGGLPAAVPERLLHRGRPLDADRQATEPEHRLDAGEHGRSPHRPDRHQPRRRVQPGQPDHGQDPRRRHAGGVPELGLRRPERPARLRRRRPAGDRDQRRHRRAPARLGRARLEPDLGRPERCRPRRHRREPDQHRARQPADPAGEELRLRRPLHRRAAKPQGCRRPAGRGADRLPRLPRRRHHRPARGREPPPAHGVDHRRPGREGRRRSRQPLHGLGLHRGQRAERDRAVDDDPRRRLRAPRRHEPGEPHDRGRLARVAHRSRLQRQHGGSRQRARPAGADHAPGRRHDHRALLPEPGQLPDRGEVRPRRQMARSPGTRTSAAT